jgi:hypothetical protein
LQVLVLLCKVNRVTAHTGQPDSQPGQRNTHSADRIHSP